MPNSRREREEALIAEMRKNLEAYENGTEVDGFVPFELHEAITARDVSSVLDALEAAHRREWILERLPSYYPGKDSTEFLDRREVRMIFAENAVLV